MRLARTLTSGKALLRFFNAFSLGCDLTAPYWLSSAPVIFGIAGGIGLIVGHRWVDLV